MTPARRAYLKAAVDARRRLLTFRTNSRGYLIPTREPGPRTARAAPTSPATPNRSAAP